MNIHWYIPFFLTYYTLLYFFHHIDNIQQFVDLILSFHFLLFLFHIQVYLVPLVDVLHYILVGFLHLLELLL